MPCVSSKASHTLCKPDCETDWLCCNKIEPYSCRPVCYPDLEINELGGTGCSGVESNWLYLHFWRSSNGIGNNFDNPDQGSVCTGLNTLAPHAFGDGDSTPANRTPNPRYVSNAVSKLTGADPHPTLSQMMTWWGQYIDHTVAISPEGEEDLSFTSAANITEDPNETIFSATIPFKRADFVLNSTPREHLTQLTAFLDADNVYGKDGPRELALRLMDGTGKLKTSAGDLPPLNIYGLDNANPVGATPEDLYLVGDVRGNENSNLLALHTIFVRLHNILCDEFVAEFPRFAGQDEVIYQMARRKVAGIQQRITYREFLPRLLGSYNPPAYTGYKEDVNPTVLKEFSTVAYRFGHGTVNSDVLVGESTLVSLNDLFFNPSAIVTHGVDDLILGAMKQYMKNVTPELVDELRNTLFGPPSGPLLDLAALNIQRGRDMGIPNYNVLRVAYGLAEKATWADVTSNVALQGKLASVYASPSVADPWVAGLAEDHVSGGVVGELFAAIIREQFVRLRDGDRFWHENDPAFREEDLAEIRGYNLAKVIEKTTNVSVSGSPFLV